MKWKCQNFHNIDKTFFDYGIGAFYINNSNLYILLPKHDNLKLYAPIKVKLLPVDSPFDCIKTPKDENNRWGWTGDVNNLTLKASFNFNGVTTHCQVNNHFITLCID